MGIMGCDSQLGPVDLEMKQLRSSEVVSYSKLVRVSRV